MKKNLFRKTGSLVLALSMVLGMASIAFAGNASSSFSDASSITNKEAVSVLSGIRVIDGFKNGKFGPKDTLNRGQATAFICRLLLGRDTADSMAVGSTKFPDVDSSNTFFKYISYCDSNGIVGGYGDGTFRSKTGLTTVAFGKMVLVALGYDADVEGYSGSGWKDRVKADLNENGILSGVTSEFAGSLTRQDAAQMCLNALKCKTIEYDDGEAESSDQTLMEEKYPSLTYANGTWTFGSTVLYSSTSSEKEVVARFMVCSDVHASGSLSMATSTATISYFANGIDVVKKAAGGKLDAILVAGDLTNWGKDEEIKYFVEALESKLDADETPLIFCSGNHDFFNWFYSSGSSVARDFDERMAKALDDDNYDCDIVDSSTTPANCRHAVINGIHFIALNCSNYSVKAGSKAYSTETITWFKQQMAAAAADTPDMPIYIITHMPVSDSVNGSNYYTDSYPDIIWDTDELEPILKQYSQAVLISGHTHFSFNGDNAIYQNGYTAINDQSIQYLVTDYGFQQFSSIPADSKNHPGVMLFETYSDGSTKITRYDAKTGKQVREPWVITTDANEYSTDRYGAAGPTFTTKDLKATTTTSGSSRKLTITFSAATTEYDVYYYEVQLYKNGKAVYSTARKYATDYYIYPDKADMAKTLSYDLGTIADEEIKVVVTAYDVFGNKGESQTVTVPAK